MADVLFYSHTTTATTNATNTDNDDDDAVVASSLVFFRQRHRPRGGYMGVGVIVTGIIGVPSDDTIHQYYIDPQRFHNDRWIWMRWILSPCFVDHGNDATASCPTTHATAVQCSNDGADNTGDTYSFEIVESNPILLHITNTNQEYLYAYMTN